MNPGDISQILPTIEQQSTRFVQIARTKPRQFVESTLFLKVFYKRRSMKELLDERTALCLVLGLTSARKQPPLVHAPVLANNFSLLFADCPSQLDEYCWTILEDRGTVYGFLSSEEKFLPHCKACNCSVYLSLRGNAGRVTCSNAKCRIQLLAEFELAASKPKEQKREESRRGRTSSQVAVGLVEKAKTQKVETTEQEWEMIKRAAKRAVQ